MFSWADYCQILNMTKQMQHSQTSISIAVVLQFCQLQLILEYLFKDNIQLPQAYMQQGFYAFMNSGSAKGQCWDSIMG